MEHPNLVVVRSYGTRPEAELAVSELDAAGIPAMIQSDSVGGMREHMAWSGAGYKILVREEDLADATGLLTPVEGEEGAGGPPRS
jgi:hypothetical protein